MHRIFVIMLALAISSQGIPISQRKKGTALDSENSNSQTGNVGFASGILDHKFIFVIGAHHSGTSLMNILLQQHPDVSGLVETHVPENEGQHLQTVYRAAKHLGGMLRYAFHPDSFMDETSPLITPANRAKLYFSWAEYWNTTRPFLLEKSPRHTVMTRFLQEMFGASRSYFVIILRHPLGATHFRWGRMARSIKYDCGRELIDHWLRIHDALTEDVPHLENPFVFQFESFLKNDPQRKLDRMYEFMNLDPAVSINVSSEALPSRGDKEAFKNSRFGHGGSRPGPGRSNSNNNYHDNNTKRKTSLLADFDRVPNIPGKLLNALYSLGLDQKRYANFVRALRQKLDHAVDEEQAAGYENEPLVKSLGDQPLRQRPLTTKLQQDKDSNFNDYINSEEEGAEEDDDEDDTVLFANDNKLVAPRSQNKVFSPMREGAQSIDEEQRLYEEILRMAEEEEEELDNDNDQTEIHRLGEHDVHEQRQQQQDTYASMRRKLLMFTGQRNQVTVHVGSEMSWVNHWRELVDVESDICKSVYADLEHRVNRYGYSLVDLENIKDPVAFKDFML